MSRSSGRGSFHLDNPSYVEPTNSEEVINALIQAIGTALIGAVEISAIEIDPLSYKEIESELFKTDGFINGPTKKVLIKKYKEGDEQC